MIARLLLVLAFSGIGPEAPKKGLQPPGYISAKLRRVLQKRMEHHGRAAMGLTIAVVLLAHDDVSELALQIADEPGLARPRDGEADTLNSALPAPFFEFQDQLRLRARELSTAAASRNNGKMNVAFGKLTATCMGCHSAYLNGPGAKEEWWPLPDPKDQKSAP